MGKLQFEDFVRKDRDGNVEDFFRHENQSCPPALSDGSCTTNQLLPCLEDLTEPTAESPPISSIVWESSPSSHHQYNFQ